MALFVYGMNGSYLMVVWIGSSVVFTIGTVLPIILHDWTKISDKVEVLDNVIFEKIQQHKDKSKNSLRKIIEVP